MTRKEFLLALDRHGGRFDRWPTDRRVEAEALVAADPEAARDLGRVRSLEAALDEATRPADLDAAFVGRVVSGVTTRESTSPGEPSVRASPRLFAFAVAATVATLMVGYVAGLSLPQDTGQDAFAGLLFGSAYEDVGDDIL